MKTEGDSRIRRSVGLVLLAITLLLAVRADAQPLPLRDAGDGIAVGIEYALIDVPWWSAVEAATLAEAGLPAAKHYAEHVEWNAMQTGPDDPIDFTRLDRFVLAYQNAGFSELTVALKPHSSWAARSHSLFDPNPVPQPQYWPHFEAWIEAVVERYDGDGVDDLPGLRRPVRTIEIGSEFSSYEPEPIDDHIELLEHAYEAAHRASDDVLVAHTAFLVGTVFRDHPEATEEAYQEAFANSHPRVNPEHGLADMRRVLDRPDLFDVLNIHALGDPYEIEDILRWLDFETSRRGYSKPILISDTLPTSFVAWGPASRCDLPESQLGVILRPAVEADRCRLASYFQALLDGDEEILRWTHGLVAEDSVQRVVIAAEQGVEVINMAFSTDLQWLKLPAFQAGAGVSAWAGAIAIGLGSRQVTQRRPMLFALGQVVKHLDGYRSIERVAGTDPSVRLYEVEHVIDGDLSKEWIAWLDPGRAVLPGDEVPTLDVTLDLPAGLPLMIEPTITETGVEQPTRTPLWSGDGSVQLTLSPRPIFLTRPPQGQLAVRGRTTELVERAEPVNR